MGNKTSFPSTQHHQHYCGAQFCKNRGSKRRKQETTEVLERSLERRLENLRVLRQNIVDRGVTLEVSRRQVVNVATSSTPLASPPPPPPPPPAALHIIQNLQEVDSSQLSLEEDDDCQCHVCRDKYRVTNNNNNDSIRVTRLPCGHTFHMECAKLWLSRHCTCPVCRYELETDDPCYEVGRLERMESRSSTNK